MLKRIDLKDFNIFLFIKKNENRIAQYPGPSPDFPATPDPGNMSEVDAEPNFLLTFPKAT